MYIYNSLKIPVEKIWVIALLEEYQEFLKDYHVDQKEVYHHLKWSSDTFVAMEKMFPHELTYEWLDARTGMKASKKSLRGFLLEEGIIKRPDPSVAARKECERLIQKCPPGFQKCLRWNCEEKFRLRERQVQNNATEPINTKTIVSDVMSLVRMVLWITENYNHVKSWAEIQEEVTLAYLMTLKPSGRECFRKDLYQFYKFALRKRCLFSIPMTDYKARELPRVADTLTVEQQAVVLNKVRTDGKDMPYEAALTLLCAFHAVKSSDIRAIKVEDVDLNARRIRMTSVPDVYLNDEETEILQRYMDIRITFPAAKKRSYLLIQRKRGCYEDQPIDKGFLNRCVKSFTGHTAKVLRITCLVEMANLFGPQFLREAYGVSDTHAGRFGKYEDYLLDSTVNELLALRGESD